MLNSDNLGGIFSIEAISVSKITSFPLLNRETNTYLSAVGASGPPVALTPIYGTALYTEEPKDVNDDVYREGVLQLAQTPEVVAMYPVFSIDYTRLVLIITTNNGAKILLGTLETPVRMKYKTTSGYKPGDFAGGTYVFSADIINSAPNYPF